MRTARADAPHHPVAVTARRLVMFDEPEAWSPERELRLLEELAEAETQVFEV